jgi:hypothetical protein
VDFHVLITIQDRMRDGECQAIPSPMASIRSTETTSK